MASLADEGDLNPEARRQPRDSMSADAVSPTGRRTLRRRRDRKGETRRRALKAKSPSGPARKFGTWPPVAIVLIAPYGPGSVANRAIPGAVPLGALK